MKNFEKIVEKFKFLNEYDAAKGGQLLTEVFVDADLDNLEKEMEQDELSKQKTMKKDEDLTLREFLNKPAEDLIKIEKYSHYQYLVQELNLYRRNTLLDIIKSSIMGNKHGFVSLFSMNGSQITGFAAYKIVGDEVTDMKMFAFNNTNNASTTLLGDLEALISKLLGSYRKVSWSAAKENRANIAYQRLINKYNTKPNEYTTKIVNGSIICYSIENKT